MLIEMLCALAVIMLQMFIAVIHEGFAVAEEQKHREQLEAFVKKSEPQSRRLNWFARWNPYRFLKARERAISISNVPNNLILPLKKKIFHDQVQKSRVSPPFQYFF